MAAVLIDPTPHAIDATANQGSSGMASFLRIAASTLALVLAPVPAQAATTVISLDHAPAYGGRGADGNTLILTDIGAFAHITKIAYSVTVEATEPSWISDQQAWFGDSDFYWARYTPAEHTEGDGERSFDGIADLVAMGMDFSLNEDGLLRLELLDTDNTEAAPHGFWSGTFTITSDDTASGAVPEPATWAMMISGFGVIGGCLRRRHGARPSAARA